MLFSSAVVFRIGPGPPARSLRRGEIRCIKARPSAEPCAFREFARGQRAWTLKKPTKAICDVQCLTNLHFVRSFCRFLDLRLQNGVVRAHGFRASVELPRTITW